MFKHDFNVYETLAKLDALLETGHDDPSPMDRAEYTVLTNTLVRVGMFIQTTMFREHIARVPRPRFRTSPARGPVENAGVRQPLYRGDDD